MALYSSIGLGIMAFIGIAIVIKRRGGDELSQAKKDLPELEELPRSGPPKSMRRNSDSKPTSKKKGPPPKPKPQVSATESNTLGLSEAMAKLSLSSLPGKDEQPEKVSSYQELPGGGDYEYLDEGTFYSGDNLGRWKLEEDGSFTKLE